MKDDSYKYKIAEDFDFTIDEKGSAFIALRKIYWGDSREPKLDIRRYYSTESGERMTKKGFSFLTEDGPHELTRVLLEQGYGKPQDILKTLEEKRPDIYDALKDKLNGIPDEEIEEMYDPREVFDNV